MFNDRFSAEFAASFLEASDIVCWINAGDVAGLMPVMSVGGVRLYAGSNHAEAAQVLLAAFLPVQSTQLVRGFQLFGDPPCDRPKFIIVIGIWIIFGLALVGQVRTLYFVSLFLREGLWKFIVFWLAIICPAISIYMLLGSVRNYLIQRQRAAERKPD